MKLDIDKANRITLNLLKDTLQIQSSHTDFLKMLFPDSLQYHDEQSLLDFLFDADTTYQNKRSIFINGNITKKKNSAYSRAHQMELSFIAKQLNYTSCFKEMVQLLTHSFPELVTSTLTALIDKDIENYPSDFYTALIHCIEKDEQHTLLALLVLWSVFGEWISRISTCYNGYFTTNQTQAHSVSSLKLIDFFNANCIGIEKIKSIDFAFLAGSEWLTNIERIDLLTRLIKHGVHLNVIISEPHQAENIACHMRHSDRFYVSFQKNIEIWLKFQQKHSDFVHVKVSLLPLMHNYYAFNRKDASTNSIRVNFYTYDNSYIEKNLTEILDSKSPHYQLFKQEFRYLWSISRDITDFTGNAINKIN